MKFGIATQLCIAIVALSFASAADSFQAIAPKSSLPAQEHAVAALIQRLLPSYAHRFVVSVVTEHQDGFTLSTTANGSLSIVASSGVTAAWGFNHFLKKYCFVHVSWSGDQLRMPKVFPRLSKPITVTSNKKFRYYQNVCTSSYSFVWWDWKRWQREIDWMAMNGINLPLAFTGQETIWRKVYKRLGFTDQELWAHFSGPAFLAWQRMGNLEAWGGPNSYDSWYDGQLALQQKILTEMRLIGMTPVLPGFAGHVPKAITRLFPKAKVTKLSDWGSFPPQYCCTYFLDPLEPLFQKIGSMFIKEQQTEYNGTDHIYSADSFNEMTPSSSNVSYLAAVSAAVLKGMTTADENAIWLMQGWLFLDAGFWKPPQIKALLHGVPIGKMIVLDLYAEISPLWERTESFYGQPFIWCMLHNFGGNNDMYGAARLTIDGVLKATKEATNMIGTGLTPEGIEQNYVMYELMNEMGWRKESFKLSQWVVDYAHRRYGSTNGAASEAWQLLIRSVFNSSGGWSKFPLPVKRPSMVVQVHFWYVLEDVCKAWHQLVDATDELAKEKTFRFDLVNVGKQVLQNLAWPMYQEIVAQYKLNSSSGVKRIGLQLVDLLKDMDRLLASDEHFLLGNWLESAKSVASSQQQETLYEFNARNQITLWGPNGNVMDYASKLWAGLMQDYYAMRWQLFVNTVTDDIEKGQKFNRDTFNAKLMLQDSAWTHKNNLYPTKPQGDSVEISKELLKKYQPQMSQLQNEEIVKEWKFEQQRKSWIPL